MTENLQKKEFEIKFNKKGMHKKNDICSFFGWKNVHLTVNGHCIVSVLPEHLEAFEETARRHSFSIIKRL
jgi:hypothetical protein